MFGKGHYYYLRKDTKWFIWVLFVSADFRRMGVGTSLIRYIESKCTSPNQSNMVMQNLMGKLGFSKTGYVEKLDEGDPELFYFKKVKASAQHMK
jgi:GNAT superfamily N-acetyltransferase